MSDNDGPIDVSGRPGDSGAPEPRTVDADRGLGWWTDAWALFMRSALLWVALGLILFVGLMVFGLVPLLGTLALSLLMPVFGGSWMLAARKVHEGGALEVGDLFGGFQAPHFTPLLLLGVLLLVATAIIGSVAFMLGAGAMLGMVMGGAHHSAGGMMAGMGAAFGALAVTLVLGTIVTMALWFAPALVVFRKMPPIEAMRLSAEYGSPCEPVEMTISSERS